MVLIMTLLSDPVEPAISRCGIVSSVATLMRPLMSFPIEMVRCECRILKFVGLDHLAQRDDLQLRVRRRDTHRRLARNALDQNGFGLEPEAKVLGEGCDAAVLDAGFGLEFEGS
jgi:hypothetical protein